MSNVKYLSAPSPSSGGPEGPQGRPRLRKVKPQAKARQADGREDTERALEFSLAGDVPLLIHRETVDVVYRTDRVRKMFGRSKLEVTWIIVDDDPELNGRTLPGYYNVDEGRGGRITIPAGGKLFSDWLIANGGRMPLRRDRMSLAVFKNRLFEAALRVNKQDHEQRERPASAHRSIVDHLISVKAGGTVAFFPALPNPTQPPPTPPRGKAARNKG